MGIHGWSFGGYLAALAVLRRPDVFHAAVAGAPVIDWTLYDTHYTERYLGLPQEQEEVYAGSSLLSDAAKLERPLMLGPRAHRRQRGVRAHPADVGGTVGRGPPAHGCWPLAGVTHSPSDPVTAENLLLLQVDFLKQNLKDGQGA